MGVRWLVLAALCGCSAKVYIASPDGGSLSGDAGGQSSQDSGTNPVDAGQVDAGAPDAGSRDAGAEDAGRRDAGGTADAGTVDAGDLADAGPISVLPRRVSLTLTETQQYTASLGGVTWDVDGIAGGNASVGTIDASGLYAAPSTVGVHTVSARLGSSVGSATAYVQNPPGVYTWHADNSRSGAYDTELALAPGLLDAGTFGKLFTYAVTGEVYAQPLYAPNVAISGQGTHNVLYVATESDRVYAFDADGRSAAALWTVDLLSGGATTVPSTDISCTDLTPEFGVSGTPVIDPASQTLYLVANTKESGAYVQRLHALSLGSGAEQAGSPVAITATVAGTGNGGSQVSFDPLRNNQRPGLALSNGTIFISWSSHCDHGPYQGWVMAYDGTTLAQTAVVNLAPNGSAAGVWGAGGGPGIDATGMLFLSTGNGSFDGTANFGDSFLRLTSTLTISDYFTPYNQATLSGGDSDVGAGGMLLLPDQTGAHPHLMVSAGKEGVLYLVDRDNLGHYDANNNNQIVQEIDGAFPSGLFSSGASWNGFVYFAAPSDVLKQYSLSAGLLSTSPANKDTHAMGFPGATPAISANGTSNGLVWTLEHGSDAVLRANDASDVSQRLYDSTGVSTDTPVKFALPIVANGHVYFATNSNVFAFGLLP